MASGSSAPIEYLYASNANVSNFVSVKLSGVGNYHLWKTQMLCLMKSHNMGGLVDGTLAFPRTSGKVIIEQYNNLLKGWIFGSVSEDILGNVAHLDAAKDVWDKLKSLHDPTQQDSEPTSEAKGETKDIEAVAAKINTTEKDETTVIVTDQPEDTPLIVDPENITTVEKKKKNLRDATMEGNWTKAEEILTQDGDLARAEISSTDGTVLHIAVGRSHNDFLEKLLSHIKNDEELLTARSSDGCTALHIAAIVGNTYAAKLLVKRNRKLLEGKDHESKDPLSKAYDNMHLETIEFLMGTIYGDEKGMWSNISSFAEENFQQGVKVLVNAISAKQYNLALRLVEAYPKFATKKDHVLLAFAQNFPKGLNHLETLMYPSLKNAWSFASTVAIYLVLLLIVIPISIKDLFRGEKSAAVLIPIFLILVPVLSVILVIAMVWSFFLVLFWLLCKGAKILPLPPIKHVKNKKKEWDEATRLLEKLCEELEKEEARDRYHPHYKRAILEASRQNAYKVVDEILCRSPKAITCTDESGYDIIQLAIINRSEKVYNFIYDIGERKTLYRMRLDSFDNNIVHLAASLAPPSKLVERRGAALQLQRELQWRDEVKKHVFPTFVTGKNKFGETPDMVFTREHENLVMEGEKWMKTTAESCSITAALITTIVFAAAITVPGGSNQETGIPLFTNNTAFTIFAISDAISLFASTTSLLVFLSILTARFSENDFLVSLPRRLLIALSTLLLSTIAMMVAFGATLFLVFCDKKRWMLAPICVSAFIPIGFFINLQFPLIVDLFSSTYVPVFGMEKQSYLLKKFDPDKIRLQFSY